MSRSGLWGSAVRVAATMVGAAGLVVTCLPESPAGAATPKPAQPPTTVRLVGHGLGAGQGMGQWGALGYSLRGYGYTKILGHFYGGTSIADVPNQTIRVVITENNGNDTVVTSAAPFSVSGHAFAAGQAARMHLLPGGAFALSVGAGCTVTKWKPLGSLSGSEAVAAPGSTAGPSLFLQLCQPGSARSYRGDIQAASNQGAPRTVNVIPLESYLLGVVGSESPSEWGTLGKPGPQGQPEGFQALEAQAVAARSYVISGLGQYGFADICDTTACQDYQAVAGESEITDQAVADTASQVLETSAGQVATTAYSASSGGYTVGGAFPAAPDLGDSVCIPTACNPDHDWSSQIPVSRIDADWPAIGTLATIQVTRRNGLGDLGGRVEDITLSGSAGRVRLTGDAFSSRLALRSDWFAVASGSQFQPSSQLKKLHLLGDRVLGAVGDAVDSGAANFYGALTGYRLTTP